MVFGARGLRKWTAAVVGRGCGKRRNASARGAVGGLHLNDGPDCTELVRTTSDRAAAPLHQDRLAELPTHHGELARVHQGVGGD